MREENGFDRARLRRIGEGLGIPATRRHVLLCCAPPVLEHGIREHRIGGRVVEEFLIGTQPLPGQPPGAG